MPAMDVLTRLREAGRVIQASAARRASWSERIPATGRVDAVSTRRVIISFGGRGAPYAITFEAPNAPNWRHPVFATGPRDTWEWVAQIPPRRFLLPAATDEADRAAQIVAQAIPDYARLLGWE
jgi:hypothetical protein